MGDHEVSISGLSASADVETGFSLGAEFLYSLHKNFETGVGLEYLFKRSQKDFPGDFNFSNLYGVVLFPYDLALVTPYAVVRVGYGFFFGEEEYTGSFGVLSGGLFYCFGAGIEFLRFKFKGKDNAVFLEGAYSVNHGSVVDDYFGYTADVRYSRVDVMLGLSGNF